MSALVQWAHIVCRQHQAATGCPSATPTDPTPLQPVPMNGTALATSVGTATEATPSSLVLACDIDHTMINQTLTVLPRQFGERYPGLFPPWGRRASPPCDPLRTSDDLLNYLEMHRQDLHVTGITDDKRWPHTALSLSRDSGERPEDLMHRCIGELSKLLRARKALLIISMVRAMPSRMAID
jgi:hypothetical protein